jgi:hypothetical protein
MTADLTNNEPKSKVIKHGILETGSLFEKVMAAPFDNLQG